MIEERKKVWLSITGCMRDQHRDEDKMVFSTEGDLYREHNISCLTYKESQVSGMEGTTTTVKVDGDKVSVIRLGSVNALMEFEKGKRCITQYSTPYGDISMGIVTKGINIDYNDGKDPVNVKVDYNIEVEGMSNTKNTLDIRIKNYKN